MMRRIFKKFATRSPLQTRFLVVGLLAIVAVAPFDWLVASSASHVSEGAKRYWYLVTDVGTSGYMLVVSALTWLGALWAKRQGWAGVPPQRLTTTISGSLYFFSSIAVSGLIAQVIKHVVGRARPRRMNQWGPFHVEPFSAHGVLASFPSGHTTTAFAAAMALSHLLPRMQGWWIAAAACIGLSRILVGDHYASDVVAGALLGTFIEVAPIVCTG